MTALDRFLVVTAAAVSPATHRDVRREQWLADVRDARELDLSPTALAFGALTTALFHRRAGHRSTWGESMTTPPLHVRPAPHTVRTVPVLIGLAVLSFLVATLVLSLLQRYNGLAAALPLFGLTAIGFTLVPGAAVAAAVLLTARVPRRRRALGAVAVMAVAVLWWAFVTGAFNPPLWAGAMLGVIAAAWLATWLVTVGRPRWTLVLLVLPMIASVIVLPLANAVNGMGIPYSAMTLVWWVGQLIPFLVALLGAVVAARFSTDAPARVEAHGEALVDKSA